MNQLIAPKFFLIDAHIHIHGSFDLVTFFNSAKSNFLSQSQKLGVNSSQSVLCLTESHKVDFFKKLKQKCQKKEKIGSWEISLTLNKNTLCLTDENNYQLFLIAGRQIVTKEKLEVLGLGLIEDQEDGKPIDEAIQFVIDKNSIPVIPWGVGKWFGNRKKIVENLVQNNKFPIYLGDNGNRPFFWNKPKIFKSASKKEILNIPGSDPLPFDNGVNKPGSFGFILEGILDIEKPFDSLYEKISSTKEQFATYGRLESLFNFLRNQASMQIVKRNRK